MKKYTYDDLDLSPRRGNRHTGAVGFTVREVKKLFNMAADLNKLSKKDNLFIGYERDLQQIQGSIVKLLQDIGRLPK